MDKKIFEPLPNRIAKHKTLRFSKEIGDLSGLKAHLKNSAATAR